MILHVCIEISYDSCLRMYVYNKIQPPTLLEVRRFNVAEYTCMQYVCLHVPSVTYMRCVIQTVPSATDILLRCLLRIKGAYCESDGHSAVSKYKYFEVYTAMVRKDLVLVGRCEWDWRLGAALEASQSGVTD